MKKNWLFIVLLAISALALAGTAAYFSVFGLTKLFAAAGIGITILAGSLEFAKLVTVSYVYRFWKYIKKGLRGFYIFAVIFIMFLTSIGIYGFLTSAYQQSTNKIEFRDSQIEIAQNKKQLFVDQQERIGKSIENSNERINTLTNLRAQQERRVDSLQSRNYISVAKRTEESIVSADGQISKLNEDISGYMTQTTSVTDSIAFYDLKVAELKMSDVSNEIGPYKFVAQLTGLPIDKIVNVVALLIVVVFDPLAITLLIGFNQLTSMSGRRKEDEEEEKTKKKKKKKKSKKVKEEEEEVDPETTPETTPVSPVETIVEQEYIDTNKEESSPEPMKEPEEVQSFLDAIETTTTTTKNSDVKRVTAENVNVATFIPNK